MFLKLLKDLVITIIIVVVSLFGSKYIVDNFSKIINFLKSNFKKVSKTISDKVSQKEKTYTSKTSEIKNQTFPNSKPIYDRFPIDFRLI